MAFPEIALISGIIGTIGTAYSAITSYQEANQAKKVAQQNSSIAIAQGEQQAEQQRRRAATTLSQIRADHSASGLQLGSGSVFDVLIDSAQQAKLDELTIKNDAQIRSYGYQVDAAKYGQKATSSLVSGALGTVGAGFGGYGSYQREVAKQNYDQQSKLFG